MVVPLVRVKLKINIHRGCDINPFVSYSCINGPMFCLKPCVFLKMAGDLQIVLLDVLKLWYQTVRNQTMRLILSRPITGPDAMDGCMEKVLSQVSFYWHISLVEFPPFRFPQLDNRVNFLLNILFLHLIHFPLFVPCWMSSSARAAHAFWQRQ